MRLHWFAASLNLFGGIGVILACLLGVAWFYVFARDDQSWRRNAFDVLVVVALLAMFSCCIPVAPSRARFAARRMQCANSLKNIGLALRNYESDWKQFPPAVTSDADGRPMHSWRVLILPYLDEKPLYDAYSFDEPWDGPNNSKLLKRMPAILSCPYDAAEDFTTSYRVVVGERTYFPPNRSRRISEIRDGLANTVMVVESNKRVPWMAPFDPTLDEFVAEVRGWLPAKTPHRYSDLLAHYDSGGNCSLADGSIRHLHGAVDTGMLENYLVIDDRALTVQEADDFWHSRNSQSTRVRWEGYLAVAAFLLVAFLPAFWLIRRKTPRRPFEDNGQDKPNGVRD